MSWVGILYVHMNRFYLNGRLIALSPKAFHNYCCFYKIPPWVMVFIPQGNPDVTALKKNNGLVQYLRWKPYLYVHRNKSRYAVSVVVGLAAIALAWVMITANLTLGIPHDPKIPSYQALTTFVQRVCGNSSCINELGIYPNVVLIRHNKTDGPIGCQKIQKGVVKCYLGSSSMGH
jgi:hypothetical protein